MNHLQFFFQKWGNLKRGNPEDMECAALCRIIRGAIMADAFEGLFLHIPNEEISSIKPQTALLKKIIGKIPGAPDYLFAGKNHCFFIEMKSADGKQSKAQKMFQSWCIACGVPYYVCKSAEEALYVLERNKVLLLKKLAAEV